MAVGRTPVAGLTRRGMALGAACGAMMVGIVVATGLLPAGLRAAPPGASPVLHGDILRGRDLADSICSDCHAFVQGGPAMIGPDLYGVVGRPVAGTAGYDFSPALRAHRREVWTVGTLSAWLKDPAVFAPGTRMGFEGVESNLDRTDIIAYLQSLSAPK